MKGVGRKFYDDAVKDRKIPPFVLFAVFNLNFLSIHPFSAGHDPACVEELTGKKTRED